MTTEPDRLEVMQADIDLVAKVWAIGLQSGPFESDVQEAALLIARHRIETNSRTGDTGGEWDGPLNAEETAMIDGAWEKHKASAPCDIPPAGWFCTRAPGHDGPCAAYPAPQPITPPEVGGWDHRFRRLEEGELIEESDEHMLDDGSWELTNCAGQKAPDPNYTSHRWYRRLKVVPEVEGTTTCQSISGGRSASSTSIDARPADTKAGPEVGGELVEKLREAVKDAGQFLADLWPLISPLKAEWEEANSWSEYDQAVFDRRTELSIRFAGILSAEGGKQPCPSDELIERVARAIEASMQNARLTMPGQCAYEPEAHAAIAALSTPEVVDGNQVVRASAQEGTALSSQATEPQASPPCGLQSTDAWQPIETAPKDRPILVWYDHDADPYRDPANPDVLTTYACHAEAGDFLDGKGITIARWCEAYEESNGWEAGDSWWMPAVWCAWFNNDNADQVCNPTHWMPLPEAPRS